MNYHELKAEVVHVINKTWLEHGKVPVKFGHEIIDCPLDLKIKVSYMTISVEVMDFRDGKNHASSTFHIDLQSSAAIELAKKQMKSALLHCGATLS